MVHSLHLTALWQKLRANGYPLSPATIAEIQQLLISKQCSPKEIHKYKYKEVHKYVVPLVATNKEEQIQLTQLIKQFYKEKKSSPQPTATEQAKQHKNWIERNKHWIYPLVFSLCLASVLMALYIVLNQPDQLKYSIRSTNFPDLKQIVQNEKAAFELSILDETGNAQVESENYHIIIESDTLPVNKNFEFNNTFIQLKPYTLNVWNKKENNIVHTDTIHTVCKLPLQANITTDSELNNIIIGDTIKWIANAKNYSRQESLKYNWLVNGIAVDTPLDAKPFNLIKNDTAAIELSFSVEGQYDIKVNIEDPLTCLSTIDTASNQTLVSVIEEKIEYIEPDIIKERKAKIFITEPAGKPKPIIYKRNFRNWWWLIFLFPLVVWYLLNRILKNEQHKIEQKQGFTPPDTSHWDSRPIELEFDNKGELINFGNSLKESSLLMRQKSEWESKRINAGKTADKSAQNYGWFSPVFQTTKLVKDFIILIDSEFPDSHQTALFKVLTERLQSFQISLDVYYYSYYIDTLYDAENNKYATQKIIQNQPDAYVIIFGEAEALIDLNKLLLNRQSMDLFSQLTQKKAIVSPVAIKDWSAREAILKTAFVVVPADLEAFNLMLQALITGIPAEEEKLRQLINRQYACIFYDFTELKELQAYLSQYDTKDTEKLLQWLCALAVYPKLNWSITVKLGAALSKAMKMETDLLQYNTLLLMSRIKWLHDGLLKDNLRLQMLKKLNTKNEIIARHTIMQLLEEVSDKVGEKALANFEYQSQRAVNGFFLDDKKIEEQSLNYKAEKNSMRYWEKLLTDWPLEKYIDEAAKENSIESLMPQINGQKAGSFSTYFELKDTASKQQQKNRKYLSNAASLLAVLSAMVIFWLQNPLEAQPYNLFIDFNTVNRDFYIFDGGNWCFGTLDTMNISFTDQNGTTKTIEKLDRHLKINDIRVDENLGILKIEHENLLITDTINLKAEKPQQKIVDSLYVVIGKCFCPYENWNTENKAEVYCLDLSHQKLDTIPVLDLFSNLKFLNLDYNQIQKIENLDQLKQLERLYLRKNQIQKIENLDQLKQLERLDLSKNQIQKIENLDQLKQLEYLSLSSNKIQKIENLDQLKQLESLDLSSNQIQKIENLDQLKQLEILYLSDNQIQKIENLDQLKQLEILHLSDNQIQKIENLDQLKQLEILDLYFNQIQKIENLSHLSPPDFVQLREGIDLSANPINAIDASGIPQNPKSLRFDSIPALQAVYDSLVNALDQQKYEILSWSQDGSIKLRDTDTALLYYQKSINNLTNNFRNEDVFQNPNPKDSTLFIYSNPDIIRELNLKANAAYKYYQQNNNLKYLSLASQTYQTVFDFHDQLQKNISTENSRLFQAKNIVPYIENALEVTYEFQTKGQNVSDAAFRLMEKNKATVLLQSMNEADALQFAYLPDSLLVQEKDLKIAISFHNKQLNEAIEYEDTTAIERLEKILFEEKQQYSQLINNLENSFPNYYRLKYQQNQTQLKNVQQTLDDQTALVEYFVGDSTIYILSIQKEQSKLYQINKPKHWDSIVTDFSSTLNAKEMFYQNVYTVKLFNTFTESAAELYRLLLKEAVDDLGDNIRALQIIPDAELNYFPFELLLTNKITTTEINYRNLPYLLNEKAISYAYSTALLLENKIGEQQNFKQNYAGFAPNNKNYLSLNATKGSVIRITELLKGISFIDSEATKINFKEKIAQAKTFQLAMHSILDDDNPLSSKLIFSNDTLEAYELYNMKIPAQLGVLSACETGTGKLAKGEGIMSLSRAFTYAGCHSLLMSLWSIEDESTAVIVEQFFKNLQKDKTKDEALRQAKLDFLQNTPTQNSHPIYWAGLILTGDTDSIDFATQNWWRW